MRAKSLVRKGGGEIWKTNHETDRGLREGRDEVKDLDAGVRDGGEPEVTQTHILDILFVHEDLEEEGGARSAVAP